MNIASHNIIQIKSNLTIPTNRMKGRKEISIAPPLIIPDSRDKRLNAKLLSHRRESVREPLLPISALSDFLFILVINVNY